MSVLRRIKMLSGTRLIAGGYAAIILCGALLLLLPVATASGESAGALNAFFTAVSATCVTGLVHVDTGTYWSVFGQVVILCLIQVGGLGFMSFFALFSMVAGRRMSLRSRGLLRDSINYRRLGGVDTLFRVVLCGTFLIEFAGAALLACSFVPRYGARGLWYALFHSVSAFCNAGFDILGKETGVYSSVTGFYDSPLVVLTLAALVILGGMGFFVWQDVYYKRRHLRGYSLHAKVALFVTAVLLVLGTLLFFITERDASMAGMGIGDRLLNSFFCAVTPRTAGMNTVDLTKMSTAGIFLTDVLMFIGGSPGSTAGGVKTVTIAVLIISAWANLKNAGSRNVFGRRLPDDAVKKATTVLVVNALIAFLAVFCILALQPGLRAGDVIFCAISAQATVGLSAVELSVYFGTAAKLILMGLMYCGRVGSMSFALLFTEKKVPSAVVCPAEEVMIG